ncbi:MAG: oxidoreductase [Planctomycetota bacterium]|jgi:2,4-dienoyl-CoA reductase-like NADH-dependent reductase (Old Yellow Enzyme family)
MADFLSGNSLFKDFATLRAEVRRLGLPIVFEPEIRELLSPAEIAGRRIGNRLVIQPMEGCDGTLDGRPSETTYHRWGRFARGGAKMLWGEATAVLAEGRANRRQLVICRENAGDFARLVDFARAMHVKEWSDGDDFLIGLQLTHSGRFCFDEPVIVFHDAAVDAVSRFGESGKPMPGDYPVVTDEQLQRIQDAFVEAARLARKAGFDFVDIKQCHRYLLSELLAARTREGGYGGSLRNRTRFVCELLGRISSEVGGELILASRMNFFDGVPYVANPRTGRGEPVPVQRPYLCGFGVDPERPTEPELNEPLETVRLLREAGLRLLNVSLGCPYFNPHISRPADKPPPDGYEPQESPLVGVARAAMLAEAAQRANPGLPVVGTGYSYLRHYAAAFGEANLRAGRVALVGFGRGALAYPDFVKDLMRHGRMDREKVCCTDSRCTALMRAKGSELGQYAAGCALRDPVYARLYKQLKLKDRKG